MGLKKPRQGKKTLAKVTEQDIDNVIGAGGSVPVDIEKQSDRQPDERPPVKFQMVIPADLCERIDSLRSPSKTSRRAWLLQLAVKEIARLDGEIS